MREHEIYTMEGSELREGAAWHGVVDSEIIQVKCCEFDLAEEVIAKLTLKNGEYEVGIGEVLRPYIQVYHGDSEEEADAAFDAEVAKHVN